jgi:probable phosphoglycerate mutase
MIRHGESVANEQGRAGGPLGDGGLTDRGRAQARALASRLATTQELSTASALYTSTLPRAIETGAIVQPAIGAKLAAVTDESLGELGVGEADGLTWEEIGERYVAPDWNKDPFAPNVPGGESLMEFFDRCTSAVNRLVARHPGELVVLVVHGGVIEQALKIYQGLTGDVRLRPRIEFCSMSEFEFDGDRRRLLRYNDLSPIGAA